MDFPEPRGKAEAENGVEKSSPRFLMGERDATSSHASSLTAVWWLDGGVHEFFLGLPKELGLKKKRVNGEER